MGHAPPLVLVVDDDPSIRRSVKRLLRSAGFDVEVFATAEEFLAFDRPARCLCLVLDLHLPDMQGLDLLRRLVAADGNLPVVTMTGDPDPRLRDRALQEGAVAFLHKPFDEERFLGEVRRLLGPA